MFYPPGPRGPMGPGECETPPYHMLKAHLAVYRCMRCQGHCVLSWVQA